jgi:hypothetical protein
MLSHTLPSLSFRRVVLVVAGLAALFSCGPSEEITNAEDGDESASVTSHESALTAELSDEVTSPVSTTPEALAQAAATRVGSHLVPASCFTKTVVGATVTYTMNDCTGPWGLVHLTGTITAVYSRATTGGVAVAITGAGIKANNATLDLNANVVAAEVNGVRVANVTTEAKGTGARGLALTRKGAYVAKYDPTAQCITVDGSWTTTTGLRSASTTIANYTRCKGACPAAGGTLVHTGVRNTAVTVTYDGTSTAAWASSNGRAGNVPLMCGK